MQFTFDIATSLWVLQLRRVTCAHLHKHTHTQIIQIYVCVRPCLTQIVKIDTRSTTLSELGSSRFVKKEKITTINRRRYYLASLSETRSFIPRAHNTQIPNEQQPGTKGRPQLWRHTTEGKPNKPRC